MIKIRNLFYAFIIILSGLVVCVGFFKVGDDKIVLVDVSRNINSALTELKDRPFNSLKDSVSQGNGKILKVRVVDISPDIKFIEIFCFVSKNSSFNNTSSTKTIDFYAKKTDIGNSIFYNFTTPSELGINFSDDSYIQ